MAEELRERVVALLRDPRCPSFPVYRTGGGRAVYVAEATAFVRQELGRPIDEAEIEAAVREAGGRRQRLVDPWSAPSRAFLRLIGRPKPASDLLELPAKFFDASGEGTQAGRGVVRDALMRGLVSGLLFALVLGLWKGDLGSTRNVVAGVMFGSVMALLSWLGERR